MKTLIESGSSYGVEWFVYDMNKPYYEVLFKNKHLCYVTYLSKTYAAEQIESICQFQNKKQTKLSS